MTAYRVEAFMVGLGGGQMSDFEEWLPDHVKPPKQTSYKAPYSKFVVESAELAFEMGLMSQSALALLDAKKLRASGAWKNKNG